jgi:hypothetical protein
MDEEAVHTSGVGSSASYATPLMSFTWATALPFSPIAARNSERSILALTPLMGVSSHTPSMPRFT